MDIGIVMWIIGIIGVLLGALIWNIKYVYIYMSEIFKWESRKFIRWYRERKQRKAWETLWNIADKNNADIDRDWQEMFKNVE